jgi:hypothetical protein
MMVNNESAVLFDGASISGLHSLRSGGESKLKMINNVKYHNNEYPIGISDSRAFLEDINVYENFNGGIAVSNWAYPDNKVIIKNSNIHNNQGFGVMVQHANVSILDSNIYMNSSYGYINLSSSRTTIEGGTNIHDNGFAEIYTIPATFPIFIPDNGAIPHVYISYHNPNLNSEYLLMFPTSSTGIGHAHPLNIDISDPNRFFPEINRFCFGDPCVSGLLAYYDAIDHMQNHEYEISMALLKGIIDHHPETIEAIYSVTILPHIQGGIDGDFMSLLPYLEQIGHDNLTDIVVETIARITMFSHDYYPAVYLFDDIINTSDDDISQLLAELDLYYCLWQLYESGSRSVPNVSRVHPQSFVEYHEIRQNILNRLNEVKTKETNDVLPVTDGISITSTNFPNPFNPETTIQFTISNVGSGFTPDIGTPQTLPVRLSIYNIRGQRIKTLLDGSTDFTIGTHTVVWNGRDNQDRQVSSGIYFYRINANEQRITKRMLLLK